MRTEFKKDSAPRKLINPAVREFQLCVVLSWMAGIMKLLKRCCICLDHWEIYNDAAVKVLHHPATQRFQHRDYHPVSVRIFKSVDDKTLKLYFCFKQRGMVASAGFW